MFLENVRDEIKATAQCCEGTPTAKLVAILIAAGITDTKEIAAVIGIGDRAVRKVRAELQDRKSSSGGTTGPEPQGRDGTTVPQAELQDRNSSSETPRAPARKESPSGIVINSGVSEVSPPSPSNVIPVASWRGAFGADDSHGVSFVDGRLTLVNGTKAFWLERFDGDEEGLNLALIEAAGSLQRNSNTPLKAQVERKLAHIARDRRDRDRRYQQAVKKTPPAAAAKVSTARAVLAARKAREVRV